MGSGARFRRGVDTLSDKKNVVDGRDDRECKRCIKKRAAEHAYPILIDNLREQDEEDGGDLGKRVDLAEYTGTKISNAHSDIENSGNRHYAEVSTEHQDRISPRDLVNK
jgi:hypothetical protein